MRLLVITVLAAACSPGAPAGPTYRDDVEQTLSARCVSCHRQGGIAPFALETYEQARRHAGEISAAVASRRMPPWLPADGCGQPFTGDPTLEQGEIDQLVAWAQAPVEGATSEASTPTSSPDELPRVDLELAMREPYTPSASLSDDYRCFVIDPQLTGRRVATGYNVVPQSTAQVHHVLLFVVERSVAEQADAADPGNGFQCFGSGGARIRGALGVWVPGSGAVRFPAGTGIPLDPDSVVVMQLHYNTLNGRGADQSRLQLMFADRSVTSALMLGLTAKGFSIPPRTTGFEHSERVANSLGLSLDVWGVLPHMHTRGRSISVRSDKACLVNIPQWDFHWQRMYFRKRPLAVAGDDGLTVDCTWDNPSDTPLSWGERTTDEMCFAVVYATPSP